MLRTAGTSSLVPLTPVREVGQTRGWSHETPRRGILVIASGVARCRHRVPTLLGVVPRNAIFPLNIRMATMPSPDYPNSE